MYHLKKFRGALLRKERFTAIIPERHFVGEIIASLYNYQMSIAAAEKEVNIHNKNNTKNNRVQNVSFDPVYKILHWTNTCI